MESLQNVGNQEPNDEQAQRQPVETILRGIDELVERTISDNTNLEQNAANTDVVSLRFHQSALLKRFKGIMIEIQSKAAKATHDIESKLGPDSQLGHMNPAVNDALEDLVGVPHDSDLNRVLGRTYLNDKQSFKLRNFSTGSPDPRIIVSDDSNVLFPSADGPIVILRPTLRNVYVVQHAYVRLLNHKEKLIKDYFDSADLGVGSSRKFSREYYENLSLANLPSKNKLGTLLDVKHSSFSHSTQDLGLALVYTNPDGRLQCVEAVTGEVLNIRGDNESSYIILPVAEVSIKKLYDTYRSLRDVTSEQRRAAKDKEFASKLPIDEMDVLTKQLGDGESNGAGGGNSKKRRRMLDDDE
ncbi:uncharacterized protein F4822DRAFT_148962 [Hypoxylon trugodes]|uniref:uncharacterized protein n=1 Tax=Hypoxylon trugodes TaxID=326681 RepID=UPI0021A12436|nr:uncharacterized protein F4822DRAFT_148962 [Hypoxylon trugodes]KAI1393035.1 hypothetical protein F4822DRAFT_148962 [Hypoxylon trugodes]